MTTQITDNVAFARLKKLTEKICRYESHRHFLKECVNGEIVLKGFTLKWMMDLHTNEEENGRVNAKVLHRTSLHLMSEGIAVCDRVLREVINLKKEYSNKMSSSITKHKFEKLQKELEQFSLETQIELLRTKKKKLSVLKKDNTHSKNSLILEVKNVATDKPEVQC